MEKPIWQHILFSALIVVVIGGTFSRVLPCHWSGMVNDVGDSGAWIVYFIFNSIYAIFVVVGIALSICSIHILGGSSKFYFSLISSGTTIALLYVVSAWDHFPSINFGGIVFLLILLSWSMNIVLYLIDKNLTN